MKVLYILTISISISLFAISGMNRSAVPRCFVLQEKSELLETLSQKTVDTALSQLGIVKAIYYGHKQHTMANYTVARCSGFRPISLEKVWW